MKHLQTTIFSFALLLSAPHAGAQMSKTYHTVEQGQTLYSIATMYNIPVSLLVSHNPQSENVLHVGDKLIIPTQSNKSGMTFHTIANGETLYQLTKRYHVSAQSICKANPGLSETNFKVGEVVKIPMVDQVLAQQDQMEQQAAARVRSVHKVKKKETIYGIAQHYNITEQELINANPSIATKPICKGDKLNIPFHQVNTNTPTNKELFTRSTPAPSSMNYVKMAVVLPFDGKSSTNARMIEFYRGILMAADTLKHQGLNIDIHTYEAGNDGASVDKVLAQPELKNMNLIICPPSALQVSKLSDFSKANGIYLVVPFTSNVPEVYNNPYLFLLNTPKSFLYANVSEMVANNFGNCNYVFVNTGNNANTGEFVIQMRKTAALKNCTTTDVTLSTSNWNGAIMPGKTNVIVPNSDRKDDMNALLTQVKALKQNGANNIAVLGYPDWKAYATTSSAQFCDTNTYLFSPYYATSNNEMQMNRNYQSWFRSGMLNTTPRFAMYGFDVASFFIKGVSTFGKGLNEDNVNKVKPQLLQSRFKFERTSTWGGFINKDTQLIHYKSNGYASSIR